MSQTSEGLLENWLNDPELQKGRELFQKRWNQEIESLTNDLTIDMINDIRRWRCEEDLTWRSIAACFYDKYYEFSYSHSIDCDQISGMQLCEVAQKLLNQKTEEGWN